MSEKVNDSMIERAPAHLAGEVRVLLQRGAVRCHPGERAHWAVLAHVVNGHGGYIRARDAAKAVASVKELAHARRPAPQHQHARRRC